MEKSLVEAFDQNYREIKENIARAAKESGRSADDIILLAATKTVDTDFINYAIGEGIKYIGENRVQEFLSKEEQYAPAHRHFIGHLQTNKVKDIVGRVELIHSVDTVKLAREISKQSEKRGIVSDILLEINIGDEESKSGFSAEGVLDTVKEIAALPAVSIKGLMAIPPVCEAAEENRKYFRAMYKLFIDIKAQKIDNSSMEILSMGMSDDYDVAISEGANLVRIGTALFGKRNYNI